MASLFRRSNGYYYILKTVNNHRVWQSTGTRNKAKALKHLMQGQKPTTHPASLKLSQFQDQVISYARTNVAPRLRRRVWLRRAGARQLIVP